MRFDLSETELRDALGAAFRAGALEIAKLRGRYKRRAAVVDKIMDELVEAGKAREENEDGATC